jgi:hypothetical protein
MLPAKPQPVSGKMGFLQSEKGLIFRTANPASNTRNFRGFLLREILAALQKGQLETVLNQRWS